jgi:GDPmannose 4,6-dehydratase
MTVRKALITGITGQDGSYLAEALLARNYEVYGLCRTPADRVKPELAGVLSRVRLLHGDLTDRDALDRALAAARPAEIYNLAAQSNPRESWGSPEQTDTVNAQGARNLFEAALGAVPSARVFQASSSEMFGDAARGPLDEHTPLAPLSPYAAAKAKAHELAQLMRRGKRQFVTCGILFNHESPRRPMRYVVQKIAYGAACIGRGIRDSAATNENGEPIVREGRIALGNLDAVRDWGYAGDYVEAMWLALQHDEPDDFVIGTGVGHSIRDVCRLAFRCVGRDWERHVVADPRLVRVADPAAAVANPARARARLGWSANMPFAALVETMVKSHTERLATSLGRRN